MGRSIGELLEQLHAAVDAVVTALDGPGRSDGAGDVDDPMDDGALHQLVVGVQRERDRLGVVAAEAVGRWDRRCVWLSDGSRSAAHRLARETNTSVRAACMSPPSNMCSVAASSIFCSGRAGM